jgi:hypothetical protein
MAEQRYGPKEPSSKMLKPANLKSPKPEAGSKQDFANLGLPGVTTFGDGGVPGRAVAGNSITRNQVSYVPPSGIAAGSTSHTAGTTVPHLEAARGKPVQKGALHDEIARTRLDDVGGGGGWSTTSRRTARSWGRRASLP